MHWVSKLLALAATGALGTNALETSIFTFPSSSNGSPETRVQSGTVSEDVARLILELRTKTSLASVLGLTETDTIDRLNEFAETEPTLFGDSTGHAASGKSILLLQGLEQQVGTHMRKSVPDALYVPHASWDLVESPVESVMQSDTRGERCIYPGSAAGMSAKQCLSRDPILSLSQTRDTSDEDFLGLIDWLDSWVSKDRTLSVAKISFKKSSSNGKAVIRSVESLFQHLAREASSGNREITAMIVPATQDSRASTRMSQPNKKVLPRSVTPRAGDGLPLHSNLAPVCHASNSSCIEATNNCSDHGSCYLKHGSGDEGSDSNCYACRCKPTVVKNKDGTTSKISWGGPACEKEDISSPFWLIAGVTVLVIAMVGGAVGMLFSVGSQELPSVIAAGVGASKAQT